MYRSNFWKLQGKDAGGILLLYFLFLETVYGFNQEIRGAGGIYFFSFLFLESVYGFNQKIRGAGGNIFLQKRSFHTNIHTAGPSTIEAIWCGLMYQTSFLLPRI